MSGIAARHSQVTSSTTLRTWKCCPLANLVMHSTGKQSPRLSDPFHSSDQRALGRASTKNGPRVPIALRRAFRLRTVSVVEKTVPGTVL